jgi:Flp pilus assembly protein TadD
MLTGELATRNGDTVRALQSFGKAFELSPTGPAAFSFAMAYARFGMDPLAEEQFAKATQIQPTLCEAWSNMGIVQDRLKKSSEALASFQRAEECGIRDGGLYYRIGLLYARSGNEEKAFGYFKKAIETDPKRWKGVLREATKAVTSDLDSIRYKPEFQKLIEE